MAIDPAAIRRLVEDIGDELVEWRRRLHQNPELSFEEVKTSRFVYETLESFGAGLELSRPTETSVLARLVGENPGRTIAIRADMDALPVQEETARELFGEEAVEAPAPTMGGRTSRLTSELLRRPSS